MTLRQLKERLSNNAAEFIQRVYAHAGGGDPRWYEVAELAGERGPFTDDQRAMLLMDSVLHILLFEEDAGRPAGVTRIRLRPGAHKMMRELEKL